jgi:hypothetical protein
MVWFTSLTSADSAGPPGQGLKETMEHFGIAVAALSSAWMEVVKNPSEFQSCKKRSLP